MNPKDYEKMLIKQLVEEFQDRFYEKIGYRPKVLLNKNTEKPRLTIDTLEEVVSSYLPDPFVTNGWTMQSSCRKRDVVMLRQIFCYIAKNQGYALKTIGNKLGNRDHTTVIHSVRVASDMIDSNDTIFVTLYEAITNELNKTYGNEFALLHMPEKKRDITESALHTVLL